MFGISLFELLTIMCLALILFGPDKLPEAARNIGKLVGELKRSSDSLRREFYNTVYTPSQDATNRIDSELRSLVRFQPGENCESPPLKPPENPVSPTADPSTTEAKTETPVPTEVKPEEQKPS